MSALRHCREVLHIATPGRGTQDLTAKVQAFVGRSEVDSGVCTIFVHHTSASVILCENADPAVRKDLETFAARLVPDGDPMFVHTDEGADDMPAHVRTVLTQSSLSIPIAGGRCDLGTWQGIYLWEHRHEPHQRRLTLSVIGG